MSGSGAPFGYGREAFLRRRHETRAVQRLLRSELLSVAALSGVTVRTAEGAEVGTLTDLVVRWGTSSYPAVTGLVVRVGPRRAFVHIEQVAELSARGVLLSSATLDLRDFVRRPGEGLASADVVDHQLVDVDGARVVRASDVYVARIAGHYRLVAVDVGLRTFLRRVGPASRRRRAAPERVIDWADVEPFNNPGTPVRLRSSSDRLRRLRPAELAALLDDLGSPERQELLTVLAPETAADVLEELDPDEVSALLRDAPPTNAADLLARMEPDEAVDALRDLADEDRAAILEALDAETAQRLSSLMAYPERQAGGFMTTYLVLTEPSATVADVQQLLQHHRPHGADIDGIVVVDQDGRLLDDVPLFELLAAGFDQHLGDLLAPSLPFTVAPDADLGDVLEKLIASRRSSLLVVDDEQRPLGRILADDVLDVLAEARGRRWPWQSR